MTWREGVLGKLTRQTDRQAVMQRANEDPRVIGTSQHRWHWQVLPLAICTGLLSAAIYSRYNCINCQPTYDQLYLWPGLQLDIWWIYNPASRQSHTFSDTLCHLLNVFISKAVQRSRDRSLIFIFIDLNIKAQIFCNTVNIVWFTTRDTKMNPYFHPPQIGSLYSYKLNNGVCTVNW